MRVINRSVLPTPNVVTDKVRAAMNNVREMDADDLAVIVTELQGLNQGAYAQVIQDSGFELELDEPVVVDP